MLRAVLLDLGGTLAYDSLGGRGTEEAYRAVAKYLRAVGHDVSAEELAEVHLEVREELGRRIAGQHLELDMVYAYWLTLERLGVRPTLPLVSGCLEAYYGTRTKGVRLYPEVEGVLEGLRAAGFRMAIVSNAGVGFDYIVDRLRLRRYFDALVASYRVMWKKPHPLIFLKALRLLGVSAREAVMVGDSLEADVLGAKRLGMRAVWVVRSEDVDVEEALEAVELRPDAVVRSLDGLGEAIAAMLSSPG